MLFPVHLFTGSSRKRHREPWFPESCDQVSLLWNSQFVCINCNMSYHNPKFTFRNEEPLSSNCNNLDSIEEPLTSLSKAHFKLFFYWGLGHYYGAQHICLFFSLSSAAQRLGRACMTPARGAPGSETSRPGSPCSGLITSYHRAPC